MWPYAIVLFFLHLGGLRGSSCFLSSSNIFRSPTPATRHANAGFWSCWNFKSPDYLRCEMPHALNKFIIGAKYTWVMSLASSNFSGWLLIATWSHSTVRVTPYRDFLPFTSWGCKAHLVWYRIGMTDPAEVSIVLLGDSNVGKSLFLS